MYTTCTRTDTPRRVPTHTHSPMGTSHSIMAMVPEPLELPEDENSPAGAATTAAAGMLPKAYQHLSQFPVLAKMKQARGPSKWHPNDRVTQ